MTSGADPPEHRPTDTHQLGILLVHGIGVQRPGETLVCWGDVFLRTIVRATRTVTVTTGPAKRLEGRSEVVIRLQSEDHKEEWLLAEACWADAFPPPSYRELVSWSFKALPWSLALHFAFRYWQVAEQDKRSERVVLLTLLVLQLLFALALAPIFVLFLALTLVLGWLPIPKLRALMLAAQGTLAQSVGDSLAFVESPIRAALIRTRVVGALASLKRHCEKVIVVAHSQGAAVVLDTLGGMPIPSYERNTESVNASAAAEAPDALLTYGAGTNQLAALKLLSSGVISKVGGMNPTLVAPVALAIAGASTWIMPGSTWQKLLIAASLFLLSLVYSLTWKAVEWCIEILSRRHSILNRNRNTLLLGIMASLGVAAIAALIVYGNRWDLPVGTASFVYLMVLLLLSSLAMLLSKHMKTALTVARKPPQLRRWVDIYASADPVPSGPTRVTDAAEIESQEVWNVGSVFRDHTAYWRNLDGFVLRLVDACAETARSPWRSELARDMSGVDRRAAWRVGWLWMFRWVVIASWLLWGTAVWVLHCKKIPLVLQLPSWAQDAAAMPIRFGTLVLAITLFCWVWLRILHWIWELWSAYEQKRILSNVPIDDYWLQAPLMGGSAFVWLVVLGMSVTVVTPELQLPHSAAEIIKGAKEMGPFVGTHFAFLVGTVLLLVKLRPAPIISMVAKSDTARAAGTSN